MELGQCKPIARHESVVLLVIGSAIAFFSIFDRPQDRRNFNRFLAFGFWLSSSGLRAVPFGFWLLA
jgi:hypothetical protein